MWRTDDGKNLAYTRVSFGGGEKVDY